MVMTIELLAGVTVGSGVVGLVFASALVLDSLSFVGRNRSRRAREAQTLCSWVVLGCWAVFVIGLWTLARGL